MPSIPKLLNGHVTLEVECLDRLYLNGYIGPLATSGGLVNFMREQLGKPIPSPVVLGQVTEKFGEAVKAMAEQLRREGLDFLIPLNERHLRMIVKEWGIHYNRGRPHSSLGPGIREPSQESVPTRTGVFLTRYPAGSLCRWSLAGTLSWLGCRMPGPTEL